MKTPLSTLSAEEMRDWLDSAMKGKIHVPPTEPGDAITDRITNEFRRMDSIGQIALSRAAVRLLDRACTSSPPTNQYMQDLIRIIVNTKTTEANHKLHATALRFRKSRNRHNWDTNCRILLALQDLGFKGDVAFWKKMFSVNPAELGAASVSGLLAIDHTAAFQIIQALPNDETLGDVVAINLDYESDQLRGKKKKTFRQQAAHIANSCPKKIKEAIESWLKEST